uniref:Putative secreted peptide n=1 Tax=Anopheles braziliensis TaxID=58242 RepID=A0A2M3ZPQ8_9DIPT
MECRPSLALPTIASPQRKNTIVFLFLCLLPPLQSYCFTFTFTFARALATVTRAHAHNAPTGVIRWRFGCGWHFPDSPAHPICSIAPQ